jgi:hydroxyacylglutathione hydrolase
MALEIIPITVPLLPRVTVNCYLVKTDGGFILVDTAAPGNRRAVEQALAKAGCQPGGLKLIALTHGDYDHCGNAAHLRQRFGAPVALHAGDLGMVEHGDMFWSRKRPNFLVGALMRLLTNLPEADRFTPEVYLKEGDNLAEYGFPAEVIELPGHSQGSVGLLTAEGDLFCGDLLTNQGKPAIGSIMDDLVAAQASVEKLRGRAIRTVYPGHGAPFVMAAFLDGLHAAKI